MSLEPLKPFRAIVEVIIKRKTGGGRWRYEVKVEATEAPPDDSISLRASVGGMSSAVFRLCNRYLSYAPFQVRCERIKREGGGEGSGEQAVDREKERDGERRGGITSNHSFAALPPFFGSSL